MGWIATCLDPACGQTADRHGFEYDWHGTLSLYAALDVKTAGVHGNTVGRHTVAFLNETIKKTHKGNDVHIVPDNLSAPKTGGPQRLGWSCEVHFHFTGTYSWLVNQVELWFATIQRDVIARGVFTSLSNIRAYAKPADRSRQIKVNGMPENLIGACRKSSRLGGGFRTGSAIQDQRIRVVPVIASRRRRFGASGRHLYFGSFESRNKSEIETATVSTNNAPVFIALVSDHRTDRMFVPAAVVNHQQRSVTFGETVCRRGQRPP